MLRAHAAAGDEGVTSGELDDLAHHALNILMAAAAILTVFNSQDMGLVIGRGGANDGSVVYKKISAERVAWLKAARQALEDGR